MGEHLPLAGPDSGAVPNLNPIPDMPVSLPIDPIPIRPAGYFANCYSKEEIQEQNRLAKASVVRPPADLE
jgi:hypothetical protein